MNRLFTVALASGALALASPLSAELFMEDVTVQENDPDFILFEPDTSAFWFLESENSTFQISDNVSTSVLQIENDSPDDMLYIDSSGRVGIGTSAPMFDLEVFDPNSSGQASIGFTSGAGESWVLAGCFGFCSGYNGFRLVEGTSPSDPSPLWIEDGSADRSIFVDSTGISFNGAVIQMSSRAAKTDFEAVDAGTILAKVLQLPIQTWSYRTHLGARHLGPVAEDFHVAFGLGSTESGIATVDSSGVALAAIQGLEARHSAEIEDLRSGYESRIAALEERLAALEELLSQADED